MKLTIKDFSKRTAERVCRRHPQCSAVPGMVLWAKLTLDEIYGDTGEPVIIYRCFYCLLELCGFTPLWGRVMKKDRVCGVCGGFGQCMRLMSSLPHPGVRKMVCVDCYKVVESPESMIEGGVVVDKGQRGL